MSVHGQVLDLITEEGLAGAEVRVPGLDGARTIADGGGLFEIAIEPHVLTTLRAEAPGYLASRSSIWTTGDDTEFLRARLTPVPAASFDRRLESLGQPPQDPGRGLLLVWFLQLPPGGGQRASIAVDHGAAFTLDGDGNLLLGATIATADTDLIVFPNVAPGRTALELSSPTGRCALSPHSTLNINDFVVEAGAATSVGVECTP